jgi:hypothetical protein
MGEVDVSYIPDNRNPRVVRLPFLRQQVGLGDVIARATGAVGIQPCGGCKQRQATLNRWVQLVPRGR